MGAGALQKHQYDDGYKQPHGLKISAHSGKHVILVHDRSEALASSERGLESFEFVGTCSPSSVGGKVVSTVPVFWQFLLRRFSL